MRDIAIHGVAEAGETVRITALGDGAPIQDASGGPWERRLSPGDRGALVRDAAEFSAGFEAGRRPLWEPGELREFGNRLRDAVFGEALEGWLRDAGPGGGRLTFHASDAALLNLPWELLPGPGGSWLVEDGRWAFRRTVRPLLLSADSAGVPRPLRILFCACAPTSQPQLDYDREEDAILKATARLGDAVHLEFAESGTWDELREMVAARRPHVVHLSGHGSVREGVGRFAFENERGGEDEREARDLAAGVFAGSGVRLVFVSGCRTAMAGVAGICQALTAEGHVPLALGWAASVADDRATRFTEWLLRDLAAGRPIDAAVNAARRQLFETGRMARAGGGAVLEASFALPQVYASAALDRLVDESLPAERPPRRAVIRAALGGNVHGLREGFVGRRRILQRTRPALRDGEKHVLWLTGIGGAGKSTLATRLANRFQEDGWHVVARRAERDAALPYSRLLLTDLADAVVTAPELAELKPHESLLRDDRRPVSERLRLAVKLLARVKILLVLDNLEDLMPRPPEPVRWLDTDFGEFVREASVNLTGQARLILTCRYLPEGGDPGAPGVGHEPLPDFTEADFLKFVLRRPEVEKRVQRGELSRELLSEFHRKIGGTPRFVEQSAAVLARIDADALQEELARLAEPDPVGDPGEIGRLQQRYFHQIFLPQLFEALTLPQRRALSRLSVLTLALPEDGVAEVAGLEPASTPEALEAWLRLGLLQRLEGNGQVPLYSIYPLQRRFLADPERLPVAETMAAHEAAGAFLERCFRGNREAELAVDWMTEVLACLHHATLAGNRERRRWAALRAAAGLQQRAEWRAMLALLYPVVRRDRHPELLASLAQGLLDLGKWRWARRRYASLLRRFQAIGDRAIEATMWHQLATIDLDEGNYEGARDGFGKALAMHLSLENWAGEAAVWHQVALLNLRIGNYASAREGFGRALTMHQVLGDRARETAAWSNLALIDLHEGNYADARKGFGKALAMYQALGNLAGEASNRHNLALTDFKEGNYAGARRGFGEVVEMRQGLGDRSGEARTWFCLATIDLWEGNYAGAREVSGKALATQRDLGDRAGEAATLHQLASIDLEEGKHADAREGFGKVLLMHQALGDRRGEAMTWIQLAKIDRKGGDYVGARESVGKGLAMLQAIGDRPGEAEALNGLAWIDLEEGNCAAARVGFGRALAMLQAIGDRTGEATALHNLASIDLREGNYSGARERFGRALVLYQATGDLASEGTTLSWVGLVAWQAGRRQAGIRVAALGFLLTLAKGSRDAGGSLMAMTRMATQLDLGKPEIESLMRECADIYRRDRGAALVREALED